MIKKIINFIRKDFTSSMRDNMILYGLLFPILLAFIMKFFIPSMSDMKLTVAVEKNVEQQVITGLMNYANVEVFDTKELVKKRVEKNDDMAGIVRENDQYVILLEGNEAGEAAEIAKTLMDIILSDKPMAEYSHLSLGKTNSVLYEITGALLLLTSILIGGYVVGFNIVDEKETKVIRALAVSPLTTRNFLISHMLFCLIISVMLAIVSCLIFTGTSVSYIQIFVSIIATTGIGVIMGFIIGGIADNLISAIAVVKFLMLIFMGVPIASLFVPQNLQWIFYPFAHYWAFESYLNIFGGGNLQIGFTVATLIAVALSIIMMLFVAPMLKKRLKLR
ncbi:ABC transporter permease [Brassicibacter mesophilus]|uniref:ABC transporter permease n=1 Tax=Brassicibacter mesophilus TaxID=745119 RepID=UPI003D1A0D3B